MIRSSTFLLLSSTLLLCPTLEAQGVTSPRGFDTTEGNAGFSHFGGTRRFQQVDFTQNGLPMPITSIAWRRNGGFTSATSVRTFDLQVDFGRGNFGALSHLLDDNFLPGSRTTVFPSQQVNFPDWSAAAPTPAPFDFSVTLAQPYVYVGLDALVIDFQYTNNSSTGGLTIDREFVGAITPPAGTLIGTGCIATGRTTAFSHTAYMGNYDNAPTPAYGMRYRLGGTLAPAGSPVVAILDGVGVNIPGVLCSTLYANPVVSIPLANPAATGLLADLNLGFTYNAAFIGASIFSQLIAPDAGQQGLPLVVSNARQTTIPVTPSTGSHRCMYAWHGLPSTNGGVATVFVGGGMVMRLQ